MSGTSVHIASMASAGFDHSRMNPSKFNDLQTPGDCLRFMKLVQHFTGYASSQAWGGSAKDRKSLQTFITMIDHDVAWPLVQQARAEYRALP